MTPDFDNINAADLSDDDRLKALYLEAVRRKFWPNNVRAVLEFFCFAEKALHDDKQGTPGKLFYALIKRKNAAFITQESESRALLRISSTARQEPRRRCRRIEWFTGANARRSARDVVWS